MKIKYSNEFVKKLVMCDSITCVYLFIFNENDSDDTNIIQYFIIHGLVLCIKVHSYVAHMFYACPFSHNTEVLIAIKNINIFFPLIQKIIYLLKDLVIPIKYNITIRFINMTKIKSK